MIEYAAYIILPLSWVFPRAIVGLFTTIMVTENLLLITIFSITGLITDLFFYFKFLNHDSKRRKFREKTLGRK